MKITSMENTVQSEMRGLRALAEFVSDSLEVGNYDEAVDALESMKDGIDNAEHTLLKYLREKNSD